MIIASLYIGDDMELATEQHDHYHASFDIMLGELAERHKFACQICGIRMDEGKWPLGWSVDHRTFQDAHDRLAGAWRYIVSPPEPPLPMKGPEARTMYAWFDWLREEVRTWEAEMVKLAITIVQNQNQAAGYDAEDRLNHAICARFHYIPWARWPRITKRPDAPDGKEI